MATLDISKVLRHQYRQQQDIEKAHKLLRDLES